MMKKTSIKKGFTLVEIIITLGIIFLISAISIFSFLRSRIDANNFAAKGGVQAIAAALELYKTSEGEYTGVLNDLTSASPPFLSGAFENGNNQGYDYYIYIYSYSSINSYFIYARPEENGITGNKFIICDQGSIKEFEDPESALEIIVDYDIDLFFQWCFENGITDPPCPPG